MRVKDQYLEHLAQVPMFTACSKKEIAAVGRAGTVVRVEQGAPLTVEGRVGSEFFVIVEGKAEVVRDAKVVATLGPGDYFGELALLDKAPRDATVRAATPMQLFVVHQREFLRLLEDSPAVMRKLLTGMARRIHALDSRA